jgi:dihydroorotate dehydrogenase
MRPWLMLPAKLAHDIAPFGLDLAASFSREVEAKVQAFEWSRKSRTLSFRNPLGIAGGVDKDGTQIWGWHHFGAGFVEIGTVTPKPQRPNPGRIIGRDTEHEALWNRMGFPGRGAAFARAMLRDFRRDEATFLKENPGGKSLPIFVNIGKQRETSLERASADYTWLIDFFSERTRFSETAAADAFVINISSPNTKGLRELFSRERLYEFLAPIAEHLDEHGAPGLLKLSPDMDSETLQTAIEVSVRLDLDGFIATNTTSARPSGLSFPEEGGLSGGPLRLRARQVLQTVIEELGTRRHGRLIVSAGGVLTGEEAATRLALGADLVETYSGLVFHGPKFFDRALRHLELGF